MLPTFSQNLTLQEAFKTVAQINEELKRTEFYGAFCKKFKILVDKFSTSIKRKIRVTERPRSLKPGKVIAVAICPFIVHIIS